MKSVLVISCEGASRVEELDVLGQRVRVRQEVVGDDLERALRLVRDADGNVDAIALDGLPIRMRLGSTVRPHIFGERLAAAAERSVVVDGGGVRAGLERWGANLAHRIEPGIFSRKHVLMMPGVNHTGMVQGFATRTPHVRYADPALYFGLPRVLGMIGSRQTAQQAAPATLSSLRSVPPHDLERGPEGARRSGALRTQFQWADVLAGNAAAILRHGPSKLRGKTVVVGHLSAEEEIELAKREASIVVTLMPSFDDTDPMARRSAAIIEALLVAVRPDASVEPDEDTYLDLMAGLEWKPGVRYLQPHERDLRRFAFVIHPLDISYIHKDKLFWWTRYLPDRLVEWVASYMPPIYISKITGGRSPKTGHRIEGYLYTLGATPRMMLARGERSTYRRLVSAAAMAERRGSRILGLGAFTSVVGDAGVTVDRETGIAITSGNSLTVAATLEAAKIAVQKMGVTDLTRGRAMIIGATGSIGSVCARLLAQAVRDVVLVSIEPDRLIELKRRIQAETPGAQVAVATRSWELAPECDLVVTTTSAFGQRVLDISRCKPGAVICDVARPPDVSEREAELRPDVLAIESGEVLIPGDIDFGYDIGLPPKTSYACLAETALLAMEGRFESFTLGRELEMERVKEIFRLFRRHEFQIAELRSFGRYISDEEFANKRRLADELLADPERLEAVRGEVAEKVAAIPPSAKGVNVRRKPPGTRWAWLGHGLGYLNRRLARLR